MKNISPRDSFELDMGIDFLDRYDFTSELGKLFKVKIADEVAECAFTAGDLITAIEPLLL